MTIQDPKRLFDVVRTIKGAPLLQSEVDAINAAIGVAAGTSSPTPSVPMNPKIPMEIIIGAMETEKVYPIPASITLAIAAVETGWFRSVTGKNNYGGVTAKVKDSVFPYKPGTPLEPATLCWTHEEVSGKRIKVQRWFKDFDSMGAFFQAHAKLLGTSPVYARARAKYPDANAFADQLEPIYDAKGKVVAAGYATASNYAETLKSIMRTNNLYVYNGGGK